MIARLHDALALRRADVRARLHPGLEHLSYRVGRQEELFDDLRREVTDPDEAELALLDAWAFVADVTSFYQELLLNEQYMRTATESRSLLELGRLVGSRPSPGVSASAHLALTVAPGKSVVLGRVRAQSIPAPGELPQVYESSTQLVATSRLNSLPLRRRTTPKIDAQTSTIDVRGASPPRPGEPFVVSWGARRAAFKICAVESLGDQRFRVALAAWGDVGSPPASAIPTAHVLRTRASLFGYNAPLRRLEVEKDKFELVEPDLDELDFEPNTIYLDAVYEGIEVGSSILVDSTLFTVRDVSTRGRSAYGLHQRTTRIELDRSRSAPNKDGFPGHRAIVVHAKAEPFEIVDWAIPEPIEGNRIELDRVEEASLLPGRTVLVLDRAHPDVAEVAVIESVVADPPAIVLTAALANKYTRGEAVVFANVLPATHGEAQTGEGDTPLGSGDASRRLQSFVLPRGPLTHVLRSDGEIEPALDVRVDGVRWEMADPSREYPPGARIFTTTTDESGRTSIVFGDGRVGGRVPSGDENVRVRYRAGLGRAGNVGRDRISLLLERPLGLESVTNPMPASGGADPDVDSPERVRVATARAGRVQRVVAMSDYALHARSFPGIEKALARPWRKGDRLGVELAVASAAAIPEVTLAALRADLLRRGDANVPLRVRRATSVQAKAHVQVVVALGFLWRDVEERIRDRLARTFGFSRRQLGKPLYPSELVAETLAVGGVVHAHVRSIDPPPPPRAHASDASVVYIDGHAPRTLTLEEIAS